MRLGSLIVFGFIPKIRDVHLMKFEVGTNCVNSTDFVEAEWVNKSNSIVENDEVNIVE